MEGITALLFFITVCITFMASFLISLYSTYFLWSKLLGRHMANLGMGTLATGVALLQVKEFFTGKGGKS